MITFNNKVVTYNNKWINGSGAPGHDIKQIPIFDQIWSDDIKIDDGGDGILIKEINGEQVYFYNYAAAYRIANSLAAEHWHFPTVYEWQDLDGNIGREVAMNKLKATTTWASNNGTDDYGFSAKAYGMIYDPSHTTYPNVKNIGLNVYYWIDSGNPSTVMQPGDAGFSNTPGVIEWEIIGGDTKNMFHLLRLVRD